MSHGASRGGARANEMAEFSRAELVVTELLVLVSVHYDGVRLLENSPKITEFGAEDFIALRRGSILTRALRIRS